MVRMDYIAHIIETFQWLFYMFTTSNNCYIKNLMQTDLWSAGVKQAS